MNQPAIGFVGVGIMGHGMAHNLLRAGFPLDILAHRRRDRIQSLVDKGANERPSLSAMIAGADIVVSCLPNSQTLLEIQDSAADGLRPGMLWIDTGTSRPADIETAAAAFAARGVDFVEAPVTGGQQQALDGTLGALVGADPAAFRRAEPILATFCQTIRRFGEPGSGNKAKLINNAMVLGIAALVIETFEFAQDSGTDWRKLYDVMIRGSGNSGVLQRVIGEAAAGNPKGYVFDVKSAAKDIRYFAEFADQTGDLTDLGKATQTLFDRAEMQGQGDWMISELITRKLR